MDPRDIEDRQDLNRLVEAFYRRAFEDPLLAPVFIDVAHLDERLDHHLPVIVDFWETVLFRTHSYPGGAFEPHRRINELEVLTADHFDRWLKLWTRTVRELYEGPVATAAVVSAQRFAGAFERRLRGASGLTIGNSAEDRSRTTE